MEKIEHHKAILTKGDIPTLPPGNCPAPMGEPAIGAPMDGLAAIGAPTLPIEGWQPMAAPEKKWFVADLEG